MSSFNSGVHWTQIIPYNLDICCHNVDLSSTIIFRSGPNSSCRLSTILLLALVRYVSSIAGYLPYASFNSLKVGICFINIGKGYFNYLKRYVTSLGCLQFSRTYPCTFFCKIINESVRFSFFVIKVDIPLVFPLNL